MTKIRAGEVAIAPPRHSEEAAALATVSERLLSELGLAEADLPEVIDLARGIDPAKPQSVAEFGRRVGEATARYADELLSEVRSADLDEAGAKLSEVVSIARRLNTSALSDRRSKLPLVGPLIDRFRLSARDVVGQFESTKGQIEHLVAEVDQTQIGLAKRNDALESMFAAVRDEYRLLGVHVAAGKLRQDELRAHLESQRERSVGPGQAQELSDLEALLATLDARIGNLQALQHSALQTLPQIRVVQTSNRVLVEKFHTIKQITVPAWKRQFVLALGLNEQRNAVALAATIDQATNDLLRRNADLLRRNSVEAARSNQRLVIDVSTLAHVQTELIGTVEEVVRIQQEGAAERRRMEGQLGFMRAELQRRLAGNNAREAA